MKYDRMLDPCRACHIFCEWSVIKFDLYSHLFSEASRLKTATPKMQRDINV